eukprot:Sdes_comp13947_c0_seq2m3345
MVTIRSVPFPVIAEVNGIATAAGCQLVASCDLAVASYSSSFSTPGVKLGLFCSTPGVALSRSVPTKIAMEMLLTGKSISAQRAYDIGLINSVVKENYLSETTLRYAQDILSMKEQVIRLGKQQFYSNMDSNKSLKESYAVAEKAMVKNLEFPCTSEMIRGFLEKNKRK